MGAALACKFRESVGGRNGHEGGAVGRKHSEAHARVDEATNRLPAQTSDWTCHQPDGSS